MLVITPAIAPTTVATSTAVLTGTMTPIPSTKQGNMFNLIQAYQERNALRNISN